MPNGRNALAGRGIAAVLLLWLASPCMAKEPRSAEDYLKRGLARYTARDLEGAIEDFTRAIVINSNINTRALERIKRVKSGRYPDGPYDFYEKCAVMDRFNSSAYLCRGTARAEKGDLPGAIQDFDRVIAFDPRDSRTLTNRGYAKGKSGDTDGAIKDFDRAMQIDPYNSQAHNNCGTLRYQLKDYAGAVAAYTRAIEADPQMAVAYKNRGLAYKAEGELDSALRDFDRAIELDARLLPAYLNRGLILIRQGKDAEAENDFVYFLRYAGDMKDTLNKLIQEARESRRQEKER